MAESVLSLLTIMIIRVGIVIAVAIKKPPENPGGSLENRLTLVEIVCGKVVWKTHMTQSNEGAFLFALA
jgi:hypothetical protein